MIYLKLKRKAPEQSRGYQACQYDNFKPTTRAWDHGGGLVVDSAFEAGGAPILGNAHVPDPSGKNQAVLRTELRTLQDLRGFWALGFHVLELPTPLVNRGSEASLRAC